LSDRYNKTRIELIPDFNKYPGLRWLNKYHLVPPIALEVLMFLIGGWGMLVWDIASAR
jgi:stearoyl-CoA desaturase (delta-9 desaturase)